MCVKYAHCELFARQCINQLSCCNVHLHHPPLPIRHRDCTHNITKSHHSRVSEDAALGSRSTENNGHSLWTIAVIARDVQFQRNWSGGFEIAPFTAKRRPGMVFCKECLCSWNKTRSWRRYCLLWWCNWNNVAAKQNNSSTAFRHAKTTP